MMHSWRVCRTSPVGSRSLFAISRHIEDGPSPTRLLPLGADTQAVGPAEHKEREMNPDLPTELE